MNKKILLLGGGENQLPLARRAKNLNIDVVLCDFRDMTPCMDYAIKTYHNNTLNPKEVIEVIGKSGVDGIITNSEPAFCSMAVAAQQTNLRCTSPEITELFKNKYLMREYCTRHGILSPRYRLCTKIEEALAFFQEVDKKVIIKPIDNSASRGVFSINSENELKEHFQECMDCSSNVNPSILIEEYIQGTEFTVDGIKCNNRHYSIAISEKKHYSYNENVAYELLFSNTNEKYDYIKLRETNDNLVNKIDVEFTITHAEYKYMDGNFYLIEIQARGGGNFIATDIDPFISGIDPYELQLKWCVGEDISIDFSYENLSERCSVLYFFDAPGNGGIVKQIEGVDYMNSVDGLTYHIEFNVGDMIEPAANDSKRIGWYIMNAKNREQLDCVMNEISNRFKIKY